MEFSQDWRELFDVFNRHGVEYVVIGGIARALDGMARATKDMDLRGKTLRWGLLLLKYWGRGSVL